MARSCVMSSAYSPACPPSVPGPGPGARVTNCPRFSWEAITPSARSTSMPCRTVIAATPCCLASSRSAGRRLPTGYRPSAIAALRSAAICWYAGTAPSRLIVTATGYRDPRPCRAAPRPPSLSHLCTSLLYSRISNGSPGPLPAPCPAPARASRTAAAGPQRRDASARPADRRTLMTTTCPPPRADGPSRDRSGSWLGAAMAGLGVLASAAAAVSFTAQYQMVYAARRLAVVAGLEAAIPDTAALIFASLGIALALHGRRAIRTRLLNLAAVATSVFMNALAASPGWRSLAIWAMPPAAYALASDTLIGVVRAWAVARQKSLTTALADGEVTPLAAVGGLILWLLRLVLAPASALRGFRTWVLPECPVAPARRLGPAPAGPVTPALPARAIPAAERTAGGVRAGT